MNYYLLINNNLHFIVIIYCQLLPSVLLSLSIMPDLNRKNEVIFEFIDHLLVLFYERNFVPNIELIKTSLYLHVKDLVYSVDYTVMLDEIECKDGEILVYLDDIKDVEREILQGQFDRQESREIEIQNRRLISKKIAKILIPCDNPLCECEDNTQCVFNSIPVIKHFLSCYGCDEYHHDALNYDDQ